MTSDHGIHVGKPPFFDGNNYDYWKTRMLDSKNLTPLDEENELLND